MKSGVILFFSFLLLSIFTLTFVPGSLIADDITDTLDSVSADIDGGILDPSIEKLEALPKNKLADGQLGTIQFLLGKAKYIKIANDLREYRSEGKQGRDELQEYQVPLLEGSLEHFQAAFALAPESEWAPEALYAAGLVQDYGFLQRFDKAVEAYELLIEKYPDNPLGQRASQRLKIFKSMEGGGAHGGADR